MDENPVCFQFDEVEVSPAAFTVRKGGERLSLEPKATRVLLHLLRHRDRVVSKDELVERVWEGTAVTDNAITRVVAQLRRELGDDPKSPRYIETLPTLGYRFVGDVREVRAAVSSPVVPLAAAPPEPHRPRPGRLVLAAVATVAAAGAGGWWWTSRPVAGAVPLEATQITTSSGVDARPSFGPDGRSFLYCSNKTGRFELYRREFPDGATTQVTNDGQQNIQPAWSPDGKWIAYHSVALRGIWMMPAGGGAPRRVTQFGSAPAWSPDSRMLVFNSSEPFSLAPFDSAAAGTLWTVAVDGSSLRQLPLPAGRRGWPSTPSWSRDGKRIAYITLGRESAVDLLDVASGETKRLVQTGIEIPRQAGTMVSRMWDPIFGPGDEQVYFSAADGKGVYSIWAVPVNGGAPRRLYASSAGTPNGLTLAPDGRRLLFARLRNESSLWTVDETGASKPLFRDEVLRAYVPSYSPDGQWLAFGVETQGRNRDLWVRPAEGGEAMPVSNEPGAKEAGTIWTPGGELLYNYVTGDRNGTVEFRAYDPKTRRSRKIHERATAGMIRPALMPNAQDLLASCSTPVNVCLGPVTSATLRQITFDRELASFAVTDRKGEWIAYQSRRNEVDEIVVMRRDGTESKVVASEPGVWNWSNSFTSDSRRIAYAAFKQGVWTLWWVDRVSGERKQLTKETGFGPFVRSPAWRPGTNALAFEWFQVRGNVFALELR